MSILDFVDDEKQSVGLNFAQAPSFTRADAFNASLSETTATSLTNSQGLYENNLLNERSKKYKELTGGSDLYGDAVGKYIEDRSDIYSNGKSGQKLRTENPKVLEALDKHITQLKSEDPEKYSELLTQKELKDRSDQERLDTVMSARRVQAGAPKDLLTMGANLSGGVIASFQDPVNLLTSTFGAGASAGLLKTIAIEAGINVATEASTIPDRTENFESIGLEYGTNEIIKDLITAGAFGAVFAGGVKGITNAAEYISLKRAKALNDLKEADIKDLDSSTIKALEKKLQEDSLKLSKANDDVEIARLERDSLNEIEAAYNEGRAIDPDKISLKEDQILSLKTDDIKDPILRENVREFQADVKRVDGESLSLKTKTTNPESSKVVELKEEFEPITLDERRIKNQQELEESINSERVLESEIESFNNINDDNVLQMEFGDNSAPQSFSKKQIVDEIENNKAIKNALRSCGVKF